MSCTEQNLLIKGNNLLALHSLSEQLAGKVKLIYLDPPYNTNNDGFKYNDSFNHSSWLTFMKNRLEVARDLLKDDGVIFVQCDDNEQAYLKVLMDEIFGRENSQVTLYVQVRFSNKTLNEDNDYQKLMEHIFVYSKDQYKPNKDKVEYSYNAFCYEIEELSEGKVEIIGDRKVVIFKPDEYVIKKIQPKVTALKATWATGSLVNQGGSAAEFLHLYLKDRKEIDGLGVLYKVIGMGTKGDGLGYRYITGPKRETAVNGQFYTGVPLEKKNGDVEEKEIPIANILFDQDIYENNFLDFKDSFGNCRTQGSVNFNSGKKPEQLLKRIIEISTQKGDIILDYHLGSGTTCAVAHKMGRRWIGIEQMDYIEDITKERLKKVIEGEQGGISKAVNWQGGGSFVYFELKKYNQDFLDKIMTANSKGELDDVYNEMAKNAFLKFWFDKNEFEKDENFRSLDLDQRKELLIGILDENQLYLNHADMRDSRYHVTDEEMALTDLFYGVNND